MTSVDISYLDPELRAAYIGPNRVIPARAAARPLGAHVAAKRRISDWLKARSHRGKAGKVTARQLAGTLGIGTQITRDCLRKLWLGGYANRSCDMDGGRKIGFAYWWAPEGEE